MILSDQDEKDADVGCRSVFFEVSLVDVCFSV